MRKVFATITLAIITLTLLASCGTSSQPPAGTTTPKTNPPTSTVPPNTVVAIKTDAAPQLDGSIEGAWDKAKPVKVQVAGGANGGSTTVELRAMYTTDSVYFVAQWTDPTESSRRSPWQKSDNGTWTKLKDPNDKGGDNNLYYEDKLALLWNVNDSIAGFNEQGCMVSCHPGEGKPFGNKYTANAGEIGDIWHWKSVRNGPVGQIDDQYLDNTRYDAKASPEAGRKSDPKTGGGYIDNQTEDKTLPKWALPDNKPAPPYWILDNQKQDFDDSKYTAGKEVPSIVVAPFTGDRGDISAKGVWKDGKWTLEWGRKLETGSRYDVQFSSLDKAYAFGIAVFENAQVRHGTSSGVYKLTFAK